MPTLFVLSHASHSDPNEGRKTILARQGEAVVLMEDAVHGTGPVLAQPRLHPSSRTVSTGA